MFNLKDYRPLVAKWLPIGHPEIVKGVCVNTKYERLALDVDSNVILLAPDIEAKEGVEYLGIVTMLLKHELAKDENGDWTIWVPSPEEEKLFRVIRIW